MVYAGVGLIFVGILAEIFSGAFFRRFFDWKNPDPNSLGSLRETKLRMFRFGLLVGVVLVAIGAVANSS